MAHDNNKKELTALVRFCLVGGVNTLVDFVVFRVLNLILGWLYPAQVLGYCCGVLNSYILNSRWTFKEQRKGGLAEKAGFLLVNLCSLGVSLGVIALLQRLGLTNEWAAGRMPGALAGVLNGDTLCKLIATPCAILVNFLGNRLFVFRISSEKE